MVQMANCLPGTWVMKRQPSVLSTRRDISEQETFCAALETNMSSKAESQLIVRRACNFTRFKLTGHFSSVVLFYGYRIPIVELEGSLIDLPYIKEAYVIGAPDHEAKELAAAIVRLKACTDNGEAITLRKIRKDLSATLATHKLPALLRILQDGEEIPRTAGGKSIKPGLLQKFFGIENIIPKGYSWPHTEFWGNGIEQGLRQTRPWDWCGLQRSD